MGNMITTFSQLTKIETLRMARAFGHGCDARLAGESELSCPHVADSLARRHWPGGWRDVQENWGSLARGRWPFRRLTGVKVSAAPYGAADRKD